MRLDTKSLRYLSSEDWRVLTAVEMGSKNHEVVPTPLIIRIAGLRGGSGAHKNISTLAKMGLISKVKNAKYDGYRLTYGGLDYLALHTHLKRSIIYSVGNQIGIGKESDIFVVASSSGVQHVLKIHRLGRISFRTVKANRDYLTHHRAAGSWMYMSRLAALKEHAFMTALWENGFPVPKPLAQNRHTVVMELIDAFPLRQVSEVPDPAGLYADLMAIILRLAEYGLIHGDFNEFNVLVKEEEHRESGDSGEMDGEGESSVTLRPIVIDFPQMVSIDHPNAEIYFDRDVGCVKRYFERRFHFTSTEPGPLFADARKQARRGSSAAKRLDVQVEASGFSRKMAKELESYMREAGVDGDGARDEDAELARSEENSDESEGQGSCPEQEDDQQEIRPEREAESELETDLGRRIASSLVLQERHDPSTQRRSI
ncbi:MAG: hypothetical protein M1816_005735 [Peltula sp. TS41687]|nr:MAG: hypothetical protein M1816_005735 [Peltula sp. TS41687]